MVSEVGYPKGKITPEHFNYPEVSESAILTFLKLGRKLGLPSKQQQGLGSRSQELF